MNDPSHTTDTGTDERSKLLARLRQRPELVSSEKMPKGPQPLSFAQERMWLIDRLEPGTSLYNTVSAWRLHGEVNPETLREAVADVLIRHESLRVRITESDTRLEQEIVDVEPTFEHLDCRQLQEPEAHADTFIRSIADKAFDLSQPPFLRVALATISTRESVLLLVVHHIATDGWSMGILARDLSIAYTARVAEQVPAWAPLPASYLNYALGQRQRLHGAELDRLLHFWKHTLEGLEPIALPYDYDRTSDNLHPGCVIGFEVPDVDVSALRTFARASGATDFMGLLAVLHILLFRLGAAPDHAVGSPVAGRMRLEDENIVGFFANTLVMRTHLDPGMTFREVLRHTRSRVFDAIDHQELPFERLVSELNPVREPGRNPLFQVSFAFQNVPAQPLTLPGVSAERVSTGTSLAKFDLHFNITPQDGHLRGSLEYSADLFSAASAQSITSAFLNLLSAACASPDLTIGKLSLMGNGELQVIRDSWSGRRCDYPRAVTVDQLFREQVKRQPHAVALELGDQRITYAALLGRARAIGDQLQLHGVSHGTRVGILLPRSVDMIAAFLATLETGAAWVPLDPTFPETRLQFLAQDAGIAAVIANTALRDQAVRIAPVVIDADTVTRVYTESAEPARVTSHEAGDIAALFYTSGSTGTPKGVAVTHQNIVRLVFGQDYIQFGPERRFLLHSPASFDASTFEVWGALLHGATCVIASNDIVEVPVLARTLGEYRIDTLWLTSSQFNLVIDEEPGALAPVRWLLTGGEALSVIHIRRAHQALPHITLINGYGPTETATFACSHTIPRDLPLNCRSIPIGRPLANTTCFVVDARDQLCYPGVEGELLIGGDGLTAGYLNRSELQDQKFVSLPAAHGVRVYRTGDRVRWLHDGTLEFRGRIDEQIKLRGFRIEPGEIAAALLENPAIAQATVMLREDQPGAKQLVAYATRSIPAALLEAKGELDRLRRRLPAYMVPSALVFLDALPLGPSGKIDRSRLPAPTLASEVVGASGQKVQARNSTERKLVEIWSELFEGQDIGIHDNFFAVGGHSLLASRACLRIGRQFGVDLRMSTLFAAPTIVELAEHLGTLGPSNTLAAQYSTTVAVVRPSLQGDYVLCVGGRIAELLQSLPAHIGILFLGSGEGDPVAFHSRGINSAVGAYAAEIAKITPLRKLIVTGFSYGGLVAYALTVRLRRFPGVTANAVLLEPAIRRGSAWETPVIFKRFFHFTSRVFQEGPQEIWRALIKRIGNTEPSLGRPLPEPEPEPEPTEGERAWLLVGPHMRRNVRRYSPPTTPSQGIHLVFGTAWQRSHHSAFTSLCTPEPDTHPVGEIAHHDLVDDPRCIAVWRDLISRLLS